MWSVIILHAAATHSRLAPPGGLSPWERRHGAEREKERMRGMFAVGAKVFYRSSAPRVKTERFSPVAQVGMYMGMSRLSRGYVIYNQEQDKLHLVKHIRVDEGEFASGKRTRGKNALPGAETGESEVGPGEDDKADSCFLLEQKEEGENGGRKAGAEEGEDEEIESGKTWTRAMPGALD